jgi:exonuclease SbcC
VEQRERAQSAWNEAKNALARAESQRDNAQSACDERQRQFAAAASYLDALKTAGFESPEAHAQAFRDETWLKQADGRLQTYWSERRAVEAEVAKHREVFADRPFDPQEIERVQSQEQEILAEMDEKSQTIGSLREKQKKLAADLERCNAAARVLEKAGYEKKRWERLKECIPDNTLRDFALARMFDLMIRLANRQLYDLTHRYELKVNGMRDMVVIDRWNANEERPVETLSGGESFLTSLSLALALSEMSRGRTQLNSLFLDEGFGTLDVQTLDVAIAALEGLRLRGRSVVVISHVSELTRRIPVRIAVEKIGNGNSSVRVLGA